MIACRMRTGPWRTAALSEGEPSMRRRKVKPVFAAVVLVLIATSTAMAPAARAEIGRAHV